MRALTIVMVMTAALAGCGDSDCRFCCYDPGAADGRISCYVLEGEGDDARGELWTMEIGMDLDDAEDYWRHEGCGVIDDSIYDGCD